MKIFIIIFFLSKLVYAIQSSPSVALYNQISQSLKIYSASVNLAEVYRHESFVNDDFVSSAVLGEKNQQDLQLFNQLQFTNEGVDLDEAKLSQMQKNLIDHPIAGRTPHKNYDDQNGRIGFCYGRALLIQKELERLGVSPKRIYKVFLIGELSQQGMLWDYHVATMYIDGRGQKLMIDSLQDQVLPLNDWFVKMHKYFLNPIEPRVRIYFAEAGKFQARDGFFSSKDMFNPLYKTFFFDLALWL